MNGTVSNLMLLIPLCQHEVLLTRLITLQRSKSFHNHPVNSNFVKYNDFSVILSSDYCGEVNIVIVQLAGNVGYPITLDPTVWIFDDRKVLFEEAFIKKEESTHTYERNELDEAAERWNRAIHLSDARPPVNKSITRFEREKILKNSYVMPIQEFIVHAEVADDAKDVTLITDDKDVLISLVQLRNFYLFFVIKRKSIKVNDLVILYITDRLYKSYTI